MDMRHPDGERVKNVFLPRGSLLVMEGAARYKWSHGIASRKTDMVRRSIVYIACFTVTFRVDRCSQHLLHGSGCRGGEGGGAGGGAGVVSQKQTSVLQCVDAAY